MVRERLVWLFNPIATRSDLFQFRQSTRLKIVWVHSYHTITISSHKGQNKDGQGDKRTVFNFIPVANGMIQFLKKCTSSSFNIVVGHLFPAV